MEKRLGVAAGIVLLGAPAMAVAKDSLEPRVQSVLACEAISASEARLQCYDQAIPALKQALSRGTMVVKERKGPSATQGVVKASGKSAANRYWVVLDNGDRWAIVTAKPRREAPRAGTTLKLKRTPFRNYWVSGTGWPESEAEFLGREPDATK